MVAAARQGTQADGILGVVPRLAAEPATVEEASEVLRTCAGDRLALAFAGGGTDLDLGPAPRTLDVLVRTARLGRVVEHLPADQIATVEAGLPIAAFQRHLAEHGQRFALDPPRPERATVGGVVAANAFGPRRLRYGTSRDLVLGMTIVRADGTVAKGGSKVVKNVAGFDLPRLLVGSCGTLGLIATVTVRLHPLPEVESTVLLPGLAPEAVHAMTGAMIDAQLEPTSAAALSDGDGGLGLGVRFEGFEPGVAEQRDRLLSISERARAEAEPLAEGAACAFWARHDVVRGEGSLRARISAPPASLAEVYAGAVAPLLGALRPGAAALYPTLGVAFASGEPTSAEDVVSAVRSARAALEPLGGWLVLAAAPAAVRASVDVWGASSSGTLALMRRVKDQLDPDHRLAPGRFVGGI